MDEIAPPPLQAMEPPVLPTQRRAPSVTDFGGLAIGLLVVATALIAAAGWSLSVDLAETATRWARLLAEAGADPPPFTPASDLERIRTGLQTVIPALAILAGAMVAVVRLRQRAHATAEALELANRKALDAEAQQWSCVDHGIAAALVGFDASGRVTTLNAAAEQLFGYSTAEMTGRDLQVLLPAVDLDAGVAGPGWCRTGPPAEAVATHAVIGRHRNGSTFPLEVAIGAAIPGDPDHLAAVVRDVSERRQVEQRIIRTLEKQRVLNALTRIGLMPVPLDALLERALEIILSADWLRGRAAGAIMVQAPDQPDSLRLATICETDGSDDAPCPRRCGGLEDLLAGDGGSGPRGPCPGDRGRTCQRLVLELGDGDRRLGLLVLCVRGGGRTDHRDHAFLHQVAGTLVLLINRKEAEEALRQSESRFRDFTASASDWHWETGPDLRFSRVSDGASEAMALDPDALLGQPWTDLVAEPADPEAGRRQQQDLRGRRPFRNVEFRVAAADGQDRWFRIGGVPVFDADGQFQGYRGTGTDVTALHRAQAAGDRTRATLAAVLDHLDLGVLVLDAGLRVAFINPAFARLWPASEDPIRPGDTLDSVMATARRHGLVAVAGADRNDSRRALTAPGRHDDGALDGCHDGDVAVLEVTRPDGATLLLRFSPLEGGGRIVTAFDITGWKRREQDLSRTILALEELRTRLEQQVLEKVALCRDLAVARDAAEAANAAKTDILATMSHEIRTPMTGVLGMIDLLLKADLAEPQRTQAVVAQESARSALALIDDILDDTKLKAGRIALESIDFNLPRLIDSVMSAMAPQAQEKGLTLETDIADTVAPWLVGDPTRIRQVLFNLIGNAIKFTEQGCVSMRASAEMSAPDRALVRIAVVDTGIGIPPEALPRLFERFAQADRSTTRRFGGSGLGLAICRQLVELMGGEIGVESEVGRGSTFWLSLPLGLGTVPEDAARDRHQPPPAVTGPLSILVADDNRTSQKLVRTWLERAGHTVTTAETGRRAVDAIAAGGRFDVVLMDVQMPELDGPAATRSIRALDGPEAQTPVIALTANAMADERDGCLAAGMDDFVSTPIEPPQLFEVIARVLAARRDAAASTPGAANAPAPVTAADDAPRLLPADAADAAAATGPAVAADSPSSSPVPSATLPLFDDARLGKLRETLDAETLREALASVPEVVGRALAEIRSGVAAGDLDRVRRAAHGLKGLAGNFAALRLAAISRQVEQDASAGEAVAERLAALEETLSHTTSHLARFG